jgi:DNA-binding transcriptional LysR family regulator
MDMIQNMRVFTRVVESGSFTAAALTFDAAPSAMSRAVSELETHLRVRLLTRSTRSLALTPAGQVYLERCKRILSDIASAEEAVSETHQRPAGTLRIVSYASIGQHYILPAISKYRSIYPDVRVELTLTQSTPALYAMGADVAIFPASSLSDSEMISHTLGSTRNVLCASPEYVRMRGLPNAPSELAMHDCLTLSMPGFPTCEWLFEKSGDTEVVHVDSLLQANIAESLIVAIRNGMGIGALPSYAAVPALKDGSLVRVLPQYSLQKMNIYVLYPAGKFVDARTKTWVAFVRDYVSELITRDEAALQQPVIESLCST